MAASTCIPFNLATITIPFAFGGQSVRGFTLDCGGTLIKLTYIAEHSQDSLTVRLESYEACRLREVLDHINSTVLTGSSNDRVTVGVTIGHGTLQKHAQTIKDALGIEPIQVDEMSAFSKGLHYGLKHIPRKTFIKADQRPDDDGKRDGEFPALLAMVGSAVGYMLINEDGTHKMVNSNVAGGLYCYSVGKLLTGAKSFEELAEMARGGDATKLTVTTNELFNEKYGETDWNEIHKTVPFAYEVFPFGKIIRDDLDINQLNKQDIARAWLHSVYAQILMTSIDTARKWCSEDGTPVMYYAGSLAENDIFQKYHERMPYFTVYDERKVYAYFINHGAYLGSIGGLLIGLESVLDQNRTRYM